MCLCVEMKWVGGILIVPVLISFLVLLLHNIHVQKKKTFGHVHVWSYLSGLVLRGQCTHSVEQTRLKKLHFTQTAKHIRQSTIPGNRSLVCFWVFFFMSTIYTTLVDIRHNIIYMYFQY